MTKSVNRRRGRGAVALTAAVGVVAALLAGCSSGSGSSSSSASAETGPVTISMAIQTETNEAKPYASVVAEFEKANPNITVDIQESPLASYSNVLKTQLQGGAGPDIFYGSPGTGSQNSILPLAGDGYVLSLTDQQWAVDAVPETSKSLYYADDQLWALPVDLVPVTTVVNDTSYQQVGIQYPKTLNDLYAACTKAKAAGKSYWVLPAATPPANGLLALVIAAGQVYAEQPDWNDQRAAGSTTFAGTPGWQATLQTILDMNQNGCFQDGATGMTNETSFPLLAQNLGMTVAAPGSAAKEFGGLNPDLTWTTNAFPAPTADDTRIYASPSNALAINANTQHADAAKKLLEFFAQPANQNLFADKNGTLSLAATSGGATLSPEFAPLKPYLEDPKKNLPLASLAWPTGVYDKLGAGIQGMLTGQATVDQVLSDMDNAWS